MQTQSTYRIAIEGTLDQAWSDRLGVLRIVPGRSANGRGVTILSGEMLDKTALLGVLKTLYDLHLLILTVESLPALGTVPSAGRLILGFMGR